MTILVNDLLDACNDLLADSNIEWDTAIAKVTPAVDGIVFEGSDGVRYKWHRCDGRISMCQKGAWRKGKG